MDYYVVLRDFGKIGREAIVDPNETKDQIVAKIASGEYERVVFIHHIKAGLVFDVTDELHDEAERLAFNDYVSPETARQLDRFDQQQALREAAE